MAGVGALPVTADVGAARAGVVPDLVRDFDAVLPAALARGDFFAIVLTLVSLVVTCLLCAARRARVCPSLLDGLMHRKLCLTPRATQHDVVNRSPKSAAKPALLAKLLQFTKLMAR